MVFSSLTFLFVFLPLLLACYFLVPKRYTSVRKYILMVFSLVFYACGEPTYIFVILACVFVTWLLSGKVEEKNKFAFLVSLGVNIIPLIIFKYLDFIIENLNLLPFVSLQKVNLALPIGISFYTFQILTYIIDLYRGDVKRQKNLGYLTLYVFLFPQLIAGPIVRYIDVEKEINISGESWSKIKEGAGRFILGLAKKVIISNQVGFIATTIMGVEDSGTTIALRWLAVFAYTMQIYFDFSGYSDMAIGLGRIFGFNFLENFKRPYTSLSVSEFWRRWHISMNTFFVDYIYIPLGGSRVSKGRWLFNILVVWSFTGLWHGAFWNYVLWGLYYALILVLEKFFIGKILKKIPKFFSWAYTFFLTMVGWCLFMNESNSLAEMINRISALFVEGSPVNPVTVRSLELQSYMPYLLVAFILSSPTYLLIDKMLKKLSLSGNRMINVSYGILSDVVQIAVFIICIAFIVGGTYNPFIYFRF